MTGIASGVWSTFTNFEEKEKWIDHRGEGGALSPDAAIKANDRGGGEMNTFHLAHQVIVDVSLPRHGYDVFTVTRKQKKR